MILWILIQKFIAIILPQMKNKNQKRVSIKKEKSKSCWQRSQYWYHSQDYQIK